MNTSLHSFNSNASPNFTGAIDGAVSVLKVLNEQPMLSVAVTDTVATNIPRTVVDYKATGPAGGFETLRREFSGLAVNCLMPSFFVLGAAKLINGFFMKDFKGVDMSGSWAVEILAKAISNPGNKKETKNALKEAINLISSQTEAVETIRFKNAGKNFGSNLADLLRDQIDLGRKFGKDAVRNNLDGFAAAAKKMVNTKSIMGLAVVLPLAMSMQYINRAITRHKYKKTGAPIYKDFEKDEVMTNLI